MKSKRCEGETSPANGVHHCCYEMNGQSYERSGKCYSMLWALFYFKKISKVLIYPALATSCRHVLVLCYMMFYYYILQFVKKDYQMSQ